MIIYLFILQSYVYILIFPKCSMPPLKEEIDGLVGPCVHVPGSVAMSGKGERPAWGTHDLSLDI